ncbi:hypothetical protein BU24DRAFT_101497 [Aaosphaeria arxii CBS 175.79]|uniref:Uncharacterized protein n=1 Tax=Aaosphaeria arxii CBS 175.79 TaxID=1450172 RepID=A0A6A5XZD4_9PLEO|nr:uncharacterized protein BU24DRAFT_101497 [Aaosphaeria arxii CBS 175.79]KAF2018655.1 hypothetical protein BU24DRAFT_101497 [Aaosphaeria arxii CBS 175.79]
MGLPAWYEHHNKSVMLSVDHKAPLTSIGHIACYVAVLVLLRNVVGARHRERTPPWAGSDRTVCPQRYHPSISRLWCGSRRVLAPSTNHEITDGIPNRRARAFLPYSGINPTYRPMTLVNHPC